MRKHVIAGNWKMNKTMKEATAFIQEIDNEVLDEQTEAIVCAPFVYLPALVEQAANTKVNIAAQNMHFEEAGAYTGEVSPVMLKDIGVTHVIIGHSERREYFNETNETVNKKTIAAFKHGLQPIVCVGETLDQKEDNQTLPLIREQVEIALEGLEQEQIAETIISYEPIWAIGTGKTATSAEANEVCKHIRNVVRELSDEAIADKIIIQYGGSVKPDNLAELLNSSDIDGALVGGASLDPASFNQLLEAGNHHE